LATVVIAVAAYGAVWGFDAFVDAPWAHSISGRPTLTGQWTGSLSGPGSPGGVVWLEIIRGSGGKRGGVPQQFDNSRLTGHPLFHGTGAWCSTDGVNHRYTLRGSASHSGDSVTMTFTPVPKPTQGGEQLDEMHGHWTGTSLVLADPLRRVTATPRSMSYQMETTRDTLTLHPVQGVVDTACVRK
jgi:hypothetical protein